MRCREGDIICIGKIQKVEIKRKLKDIINKDEPKESRQDTALRASSVQLCSERVIFVNKSSLSRIKETGDDTNQIDWAVLSLKSSKYGLVVCFVESALNIDKSCCGVLPFGKGVLSVGDELVSRRLRGLGLTESVLVIMEPVVCLGEPRES